MKAHRESHNPARSRATTVCALFGLASSVLVPMTEASAAPMGTNLFAPGTVVIAQGGTIAGGVQYTGPASGKGANVERNGEVDFYPPGSNGDVAPEAQLHQRHVRPDGHGLRPLRRLMGGKHQCPQHCGAHRGLRGHAQPCAGCGHHLSVAFA